MNISWHLVASTILSIILFPLFQFHALWIIVGGFLIDVDHYLFYAFKFNDWSVKRAYHYFKVRQNRVGYEKDNIHIFHTTEFVLIMLLGILVTLSSKNFFFYMFTVTFIGVVVHFTLDWTNMEYRQRWDARAFSLIRWFQRNR